MFSYTSESALCSANAPLADLLPGRVVGLDQGLTELLNIPNSARVVNLKFPRPGAWTLKVPFPSRVHV